jgi:hypothetical protein
MENLHEILKQLHAGEKEADKRLLESFLKDGTLEINVNTQTDVYNPMSMAGQRDLSADIYAWIDGCLDQLPIRYPARIVMHNVDKEDQPNVKILLRQHYLLQVQNCRKQLRNNTMKTIGMTIFGIILLIIYFLMEKYMENPLYTELFSIVGGFAIWEAAEFWFLDRRDIKRSMFDMSQAAMAEITFE